jgi:hypothetical protein
MRLALMFMVVLLTAAKFAGFEVRSNGPQEFDVGTNVFTLPKGGSINDNKSKVSIEAEYIQYREGEFIKARQANWKADQGQFRAESLEYSQKAELLQLKSMQYSSGEFKSLKAESATGWMNQDVVRLQGNVRSEDPKLEAGLVIVDAANHQALILGSFKYEQKEFRATGNKSDSTLLISFNSGKVKALTKVPEDVLKRLKPYASK